MTRKTELWRLTATEAVSLLKRRKVSPRELIDAVAARHAAVDGAVNALPTLCLDRARAAAKRIKRDSLLAGLPIAIKDLTDVGGVRTTFGSPIYADRIAPKSDALVERLEARGGVVVAKSNTPEFGAGAHTFNPVFGMTRNPWDTRLSAAGSSGGAAVALATGQVWLAHGSDLGGSLRTPAAFNGVVGLRPTPGRVPHWPKLLAYDMFGAEGPMARTVPDLALFLDAMAGLMPEDPTSLAAPAKSFRAAVKGAEKPKRVGWSADLGFAVVDPEVKSVCAAAARRFSELGAAVDEAAPDLSGTLETFHIIRGARFAAGRAFEYEHHRDRLKQDVVWNIEQGLKLDAAALGRAWRRQSEMFAAARAFFDRYDVLACPTQQHPPFPVEQRYVDTVAGVKMKSYVDWLSLTFPATLLGCPAISVPCGFTKAGLPVGLQLIAPPQQEARLLAIAAQFEAVMGLADAVPIDPRVRH
jgi:amidase